MSSRLLRRLLLAGGCAAMLASTPVSPVVAAGGAPKAASPACDGLETVVVADVLTCTHGGDSLRAPIRRARSTTTVPPAPCPGNGRGGKRIVVLYAYPADTTPHVTTFRPAIRAAIALADRNLDDASPAAPGQHYRFWCEDDRRVTIAAIAVRPIGADGTFTFTDVIASLADRVANGLGTVDLADPRRVYSVFVDNVACCYPSGGQGTMYVDDRADPALNANNVGGPHYSMVRLGLDATFTALAFQHEVGHNLGAVQDSAPHSSLAGHCYDDLDVMCYADGGAYFDAGTMQTLCAVPGVNGIEPWDCGHDDYYDAAPLTGSYLDTHWNLARSGWLSWTA